MRQGRIMSKLLNGKKWLTVSDAATYMSSAIGETVCDADILQFAIDDSVTLSVHILDIERAHVGQIVDELSEKVDLDQFPVFLDNGFWIKKRDGYVSGILDIVNCSGCQQLLEKRYYSLKGGYDKPQTSDNGIYLKKSTGSVYKLLCAVPRDIYFDDEHDDDTHVSAIALPEACQLVLLKDRVDELINHLHNQKQPQYKSTPLSEREKNSHLNVISALLRVVLGKDGVVRHPNFDSEAKLINHISDTYADCGEGLAKSTLEKRFSEAKKTLLF
jgi:hypothetical protein